MTRHNPLLLICAIVFLLSACNGGDTESTDGMSEPAAVNGNQSSAETSSLEKSGAETADGATSATASVDQEGLLKRGKIVFLQCRSCHTLEQDGPHGVGPNLHGIMDATAGNKAGYVYSDPLAASDQVWTDQALQGFLTKPSDYLPGTKMAFVGLPNALDRDAVVAYLAQETR